MIDLKFGDPALIRRTLINIEGLMPMGMGYKMDSYQSGVLVYWVKDYYKSKFNLDYKHIILTHGANGGLHCVINAIKDKYDVFYTNELAFGWYKRIMDREGVRNLKVKDLRKETHDFNSCYIVDSPNNPWGDQVINSNLNPRDVIWDSVYASPIFINEGVLTAPEHNIMVGSLSKIFGLSGLRIGWVGTNDDSVASKVLENSISFYCGISTPSLEMASTIVCTTKLDRFEKIAKLDLDIVRENFNKLKNIFNLEVPSNGMFYMGVLDKKNKQILEKAEVLGLIMTSIDGNEYIRFNMADKEIKTNNAVKSILKADSL